MPKYTIREDMLTPKENFLQCIANELAETNRLKIVELRFLDETNTTGVMMIDKEELKDSA